MAEIASARKVAYHSGKLEDYLRGMRVYPATLELDITSACNKNCSDCPSTRSDARRQLPLEFVERLFSVLRGQTRGLLLTGGEPTLAASFPSVLESARACDFQDIAVVTNGTRLDDHSVSAALLAYASTVRVSAYGWGTGSCDGLRPSLDRISRLRQMIERERSALEIGVSALTARADLDVLNDVVKAVAAAGAHWIYFHPSCSNWRAGSPTQVDQTGVLTRIRELQADYANVIPVYVFDDRYERWPLAFRGYHAAHFLLVVGADGKNYLAPEVKYQPQHVIADLQGHWREGFLWDSQRNQRIESIMSSSYPAIGSRHRGVLYNDFIQKLVDSGRPEADVRSIRQTSAFACPHIL